MYIYIGKYISIYMYAFRVDSRSFGFFNWQGRGARGHGARARAGGGDSGSGC